MKEEKKTSHSPGSPVTLPSTDTLPSGRNTTTGGSVTLPTTTTGPRMGGAVAVELDDVVPEQFTTQVPLEQLESSDVGHSGGRPEQMGACEPDTNLDGEGVDEASCGLEEGIGDTVEEDEMIGVMEADEDADAEGLELRVGVRVTEGVWEDEHSQQELLGRLRQDARNEDQSSKGESEFASASVSFESSARGHSGQKLQTRGTSDILEKKRKERGRSYHKNMNDSSKYC